MTPPCECEHCQAQRTPWARSVVAERDGLKAEVERLRGMVNGALHHVEIAADTGNEITIERRLDDAASILRGVRCADGSPYDEWCTVNRAMGDG